MLKSRSTGKLAGILAVLFATLFGMNVAAVNNPISYDPEITDCDVIKYNGEYYITGNWLNGDMYRSRDLESWGERKHIFSWSNSWYTADYTPPDRGIHAGHIRYINGIFHYYTQLSDDQKITHATSSSVWGPYVEVDYNNHFTDNIDAETFLDEDGELYFHVTRFSGGNKNYARTMSDPWTLTGSYIEQISGTSGWENNTHVNEGPKITKYHDRYYMLYAAYATSDPNYSIGCVEASGPMDFNNAGKYSAPVCTRTTPAAGKPEIAYVGQPWVVDGLNGFEKWMGYFAQTTADGRTQRIDRMHFFDRTLFVDGPTDRWTPGYHPEPAKPQLLNIFPIADGALPSSDWNPQAGTWSVANEEAVQSDQGAWALNTVNRDAAANYLIEANLKFTEVQDAEDKAGVLAYYEDANNFVIVGFDRFADNWYCHVKEGGVDSVTAGNYAGSMNYSAYHKIRVTKNAGTFDVRIDEMIPPGFTPVATGFGAGTPGIYTDHTAAAFDGIIYTIGWDEYDSGVQGWGDNVGGLPETGTWTTGSTGITMANGTGYIFKGDLMQESEFSAQVYKAGGADASMGLAIAVDTANYLIARIDLGTDQLILEGLEGGAVISAPAVSVANKSDYNIRAVKLSDRVIVFVDGVEKQTINVGFGPAQAGLYVDGMSARYNGIMAYRTEPAVAPSEWTLSDIGSPGFAGTLEEFDHALYITGSGHDIWGPSDGLAFAHKDTSEDWEFVTRLVNLDKTDYWAKAGLMFRDGLDANAPMVMLAANGADQGNEWSIPDDRPRVQFMWRDSVGGNAAAVQIMQLSFPMWLKLKRTGSTFTGYHSSDGQTWTLVGTHVSPIASSGKVGYSVTSHNNDRSASTVYDNSTFVSDEFDTDGTYLFMDNFDVADTADVNLDYATRQAAGGGTASYTYAASGYSIAGGALKNAGSGELSLDKNMGPYLAGEDFEFSFNMAMPDTSGNWSSIYLFDETGADKRGDSRLGFILYGGAHADLIGFSYKGTGASQESEQITVTEVAALTGVPYIKADEHAFKFVSHAVAGTYDLWIDGVKVRTALPYAFDGNDRQIGIIGGLTAGGALYDDISLRYYSTTYTKWLDDYTLSDSDALPDSNPDTDDLNNFSEYALGGNPNIDDSAAYLPVFEVLDAGGGSNTVHYIYNRRLDAVVRGLTYGLNTGTNLLDSLGYVGTTYETDTATIDTDFESVTNEVPFDGDSGFVELKITED